MKVGCQKEVLLKGLQSMQNIITTKTSLPILSNVLFETEKDKIKLMATDLEIGIWCTLQAQTQEVGAVTIPAKRLFDIIKELPLDTVTVSTKKNNIVTIECQNCLFKLMGLPKEEFPKMPKMENPETISMKQEALREMLDMTSFAISHDETRYILNGILFVIKNNTIRLVATDGRRLAMMERPITIPKNFEKSVIVPTKTIQELGRSLKEEQEANITFSHNQIMFDLADLIIISRLIDGEFPNYQQVVPKESKEHLIINTQRFLSATKRAALLTSQDSQAIRLDLFKNKLVISKHAPDIGEAKEEIDIDYKGSDMSLGFNPDYLIDVLKNINRENIKIELNGPEKAAVIKTDDDYVYLLLPMQLT